MHGSIDFLASFWFKAQRSLVLALRSLWLHKLRTFLSVLGIIIGTAAVISLVSFGEGSMQDALEDIKRQGATNVIIRSIKPLEETSAGQRRGFINAYGITYRDFERFQLIDSVMESVPMRIFPQEIRRFQRVHNGRIVGTTEAYQKVNKIQLTLGRFLLDSDNYQDPGDDTIMRNVAVLGSAVAEALFPFEPPLDQTVVINKHHFRVVGVVAERMPTGDGGGSQAESYNNDVFLPLRTCLGRFGEKIVLRQAGSFSREQVELHQVVLTIATMEQVRQAGAAIRDQLEHNHPKKDWDVTVPLDRLEEAERARNRYRMLMAMIAGISLLVGGIGIMNIMVATVTERTREIGIRRALGAKRRDITLQFLIEAVVQTSLGGLLGMLLGLTIVFGVPWLAWTFFDRRLPAKLDMDSIFLSIGMAISVGVLFGWYPARRASRLDPIEALRHE